MNTAAITDFQTNNHLTLFELGCQEGLVLNVMYFNMANSGVLPPSTTATATVHNNATTTTPLSFSFGDAESSNGNTGQNGQNGQNGGGDGFLEERETAEKADAPRTPGEYIARNSTYSNMLFDIMARSSNHGTTTTTNHDNHGSNGGNGGSGGSTIATTCWSLLMEIPSVQEKVSAVSGGLRNVDEWARMMNSGSDLQSVYLFQLIDTMLSPAMDHAEEGEDDARETNEGGFKDNTWADMFTTTGGFKAGKCALACFHGSRVSRVSRDSTCVSRRV
jgi:hypothetical protein